MRESAIEAALCQEVKRRGGIAIKLHAITLAGLPDRLCLLPNAVVVFVEVKQKGKAPTAIQKVVHKRLADLGFAVRVLDDIINIDEILKP